MVYKSFVACIIESYSDSKLHAKISKIIKKHSTNKEDVREILRNLIDWEQVGLMLDLGCGYGWFEEVLPTNKLAFIAGVDCIEENRHPFTVTAGRAAKKVVFQQAVLPARTGFPPDFFDLVVSIYSFYFFPSMVAEIQRVLRPGGVFAVITHSETMMEEGTKFFDFRNLRRVIENFSAERGKRVLKKYFQDITVVDYNNNLLFHRSDEEDLAVYIDFKKEFIKEDADPELVKETMVNQLREKGKICFNKNDRIFLARNESETFL